MSQNPLNLKIVDRHPRGGERLRTESEAVAEGFTIDHCASGCWYAYKGPRFAPEAGVEVETERETYWREQAEAFYRIACEKAERLGDKPWP